MNFVENNGKKVAAILCVASAFPVVATVVAAKEEPGWHGDRYVNEDKTVAKGWQEIEGKSYYFSEDGTVNSSKTENATTASVSSNITGEVKETVTTASQEAVKQETEEKAVVEETPVQTEEVKTETTDTTTDTTETPEAPVAPVETPSVDTTTQTPELPHIIQYNDTKKKPGKLPSLKFQLSYYTNILWITHTILICVSYYSLTIVVSMYSLSISNIDSDVVNTTSTIVVVNQVTS